MDDSSYMYYVQRFAPLSAQKWCKFLHVIQKFSYKILKGYIFLILRFLDQTLQFY